MIQKKTVSVTVAIKITQPMEDINVPIGTKITKRRTQGRRYLLFVDFIKSETIAVGTIAFSLERAPAAGTISNRIFAIICLNSYLHCPF